MSRTILEVSKLDFRYPQKQVFQDIDLKIEQGQMFTLLGPNGCGKTTLLHCILRFLKAQKGEIQIGGKDIHQIKPLEMAKKIAYVPQNHKKVFPYTVKEVVLMGRAAYVPAYSSPKPEDVQIAMDALEIMGITDLAERPYPFLSGGESQLVVLARAIAQQSQIIILDEPTAHLDSYHELMVMDKLALLMKKTDLTILMTTHFPNQALYLMNQGIAVYGALMKDGSLLATGSGDEIFSVENISRLYDINCSLVEFTDEQGRNIKQFVPLGIKNGWTEITESSRTDQHGENK